MVEFLTPYIEEFITIDEYIDFDTYPPKCDEWYEFLINNKINITGQLIVDELGTVISGYDTNRNIPIEINIYNPEVKSIKYKEV